MSLMLGMEAIRQLETLAAPRILDFDPASKFLLRSWHVYVTDRHVGGTPGPDVELRVNRSTAHPGPTEFFGVAHVNDSVVTMDRMVVSYVSDVAYELLRRKSPGRSLISAEATAHLEAIPFDRDQLGLDSAEHVAVGTDPDSGRLCIAADTGNPAYFDHPQDHWPGMVITEAAIQAAHHNLGQVVPCTEVDARFYRYLELSEKAFIEISVIGENRVSVCFVQADQVGAEIVLHFEGLHQPASKNRQDPYAESESEE